MYFLNLVFQFAVISLALCGAGLASRMAVKFSFRKFGEDQRGAAYTISMVMLIPVYVGLVGGAVEANWLFTSKMLFQRAALMGTRSIAVTYQTEVEKPNTSDVVAKLKDNGRHAAVTVLFPIGSAAVEYRKEVSGQDGRFLSAFFNQLEKLSGKKSSDDMRRRAEYVCNATSVQLYFVSSNSGAHFKDRVRADIEYEHPFFSQVIGRFFGEKSVSSNMYVYQFKESIDVPLEIARSSNGKMGVR